MNKRTWIRWPDSFSDNRKSKMGRGFCYRLRAQGVRGEDRGAADNKSSADRLSWRHFRVHHIGAYRALPLGAARAWLRCRFQLFNR